MLLFIVGTGRSGTSLLQSMLASNSNIAYLPETLFFRRFVVNSGKGTSLSKLVSEQNLDEIAEYLNKDRYFIRTGMDAQDLLSIDNNSTLDSTVSLYRALLQKKMQNDKCHIVGDKDPKSVEHLPVIYAFDPSALVIQTVRDPRDVLVSRKKAEWSKNHSLMKHLFAIRIHSKIAHHYFSKSVESGFLKVRYESLISNPEQELEKICTKLGIQFEKNMLRFGKAAENLVSTEEYSWKKETTKDLMTDNHGKWPGKLSLYEIAMTEALCKDVFTREEYELSNSLSKLTQWDILKIKLIQLIAIPADWIYKCHNWLVNRRAIQAMNKGGE